MAKFEVIAGEEFSVHAVVDNLDDFKAIIEVGQRHRDEKEKRRKVRQADLVAWLTLLVGGIAVGIAWMLGWNASAVGAFFVWPVGWALRRLTGNKEFLGNGRESNKFSSSQEDTDGHAS